MAFHYPNGRKFQPAAEQRNTQYGKRGMTLEEDINTSNDHYLRTEKAVIHKKPTPVQIVNVDYPKRSAAVITEAYFRKPSTTDYNGVYRGKYIDFEAKETKQKQSFPLKNFHEHQIDHMQHVLNQNGVCFVLLRFTTLEELYFLEASRLIHYWQEQKSGRKSIKRSEIAKDGHPLALGFRPRIDYLRIVDTIYFNPEQTGQAGKE